MQEEFHAVVSHIPAELAEEEVDKEFMHNTWDPADRLLYDFDKVLGL